MITSSSESQAAAFRDGRIPATEHLDADTVVIAVPTGDPGNPFTLCSVLFGTDSFWQGVDVPGEALSNVILTRLPFAVPDHPLTQAKCERIIAHGGDAFREYSLPEALLKFRQGVGRLIRTQQDKGIVVILDNRVLTKPYGKAFLSVLPKCPVEIVT